MAQKNILVILLFFAVPSFAESLDLTQQREFNTVIDEVTSHYRTALKKPLVVNTNWSDTSLNVLPKDEGAQYSIYVAGGIFRLKSLKNSGFALVICHELGHLIGGAPTFGQDTVYENERHLSNEGQADYWATSKCLRKYLKSKGDSVEFMKKIESEKISFYIKDVVPKSLELCTGSWSTEEDIAVCRRSILAGHSFARTARIWTLERYHININTPDQKVVEKTLASNASAQCRFDTFIAASLCTVSEGTKTSFENIETGICTRSKGYTRSSRPLCWYNPKH